MSKVVLAGGSGFLGTKIATELLKRGASVTILSRNMSAKVPTGATVVQWDPDSSDVRWHAAVHQADVVINLAGENIGTKRWTNVRQWRFLHSRVQATRALADAVNSAPNREAMTFIQTSATGYYGNSFEPCTEASAHAQTFLGNLVHQWELATKRLHHGPRLVILRVGIILDRHDGALPSMIPMFRIGLGASLGTGKQWVPWIHIDDVVDAYIQAIEQHGRNGVYNVVAPGVVTMNEFASTLGNVMHRPCFLRIPDGMVWLRVGKRAELVTHSANVRPLRTLEPQWTWKFPYLTAALTDVMEKK